MTSQNQRDMPKVLGTRQMKAHDIFIDEENFLPKRREPLCEHHIQDLADRIKRGITLDPMTVWENPDDGKTYILAGHHRLKAYRRRKHKKPVKVKVFVGTLAEARLKASASNVKAVLPLSSAERADTAWWLVSFWEEAKGYLYSKDQTAAASGVSKSQVAVMRRARKTLHERGSPLPKTWYAAHMELRGNNDDRDFDEDEIVNTAAQELDAEIGNAITQAGHRCPRALARVIARRLGGRYQMVLRWADTEWDDLEIEDDDDIDGEDTEIQF